MIHSNIRSKVFISYSHKDKIWLDRIQTMLSPEIRKSESLVWADTKIEPGDLWKVEIAEALSSAKVAILLVSQSFLASDFIDQHELPPILAASEEEGLKIFWVAIDHCLYEKTEIARYQAVGNPAEPLMALLQSEQDKILKVLCQKVIKAMEQPLQPSLPDYDDELGKALSGIIKAASSPFGTHGILRRYMKGTIYVITEKGHPVAQYPQIENNSFFKINDSPIGRKYEWKGGTGSKMGFPLSNKRTALEYKSWDDLVFTGSIQFFEGGRLYDSVRFGTHVMYEGNILRKFVDYEIQTGDKTTGGKLGFPITDPYETQSISGANGIVQRFIYGYIIDWSSGTYRVEMGFHDLYQTLDEWWGKLGFPISDELAYTSPVSNEEGCIQHFEYGCTQWNYKKNCGFYMDGDIYKRWQEEKEKLGFAINSAMLIKKTRLQHFEGGVIEL
jgi:uncharacterized protein with LGFP repeats